MLTQLVFILAFAASDTQPQERVTHGRYQLLISPLSRADIFLLDTVTGRTWKQVCVAEGKNGAPCDTAWELVRMLPPGN